MGKRGAKETGGVGAAEAGIRHAKNACLSGCLKSWRRGEKN